MQSEQKNVHRHEKGEQKYLLGHGEKEPEYDQPMSLVPEGRNESTKIDTSVPS